jgi:hypothetical protein
MMTDSINCHWDNIKQLLIILLLKLKNPKTIVADNAVLTQHIISEHLMRTAAKGIVSNPAAFCMYNPKKHFKLQDSFTRDKSWNTRKRQEITWTNPTHPGAKQLLSSQYVERMQVHGFQHGHRMTRYKTALKKSVFVTISILSLCSSTAFQTMHLSIVPLASYSTAECDFTLQHALSCPGQANKKHVANLRTLQALPNSHSIEVYREIRTTCGHRPNVSAPDRIASQRAHVLELLHLNEREIH